MLCSVFGTTILVFILYGIWLHILPHLRQPKERVDTTLPRAEQRTNPRLRESLYSRPSTNFIDPRNSVADTELRSSLWSTSVYDLDCSTEPASPASLTSPSLPRSPCMGFRSPTRRSMKSSLPILRTTSYQLEESRPGERAAIIDMKSTYTLGHKRFPRSCPLTNANGTVLMDNHVPRSRRKSDTAANILPGLLQHSHAIMYGRSIEGVLRSPTASDFSGTTLMTTPRTPQQRPVLRKIASTSRVFPSLKHHRSEWPAGIETESPVRHQRLLGERKRSVHRSRSHGIPRTCHLDTDIGDVDPIVQKTSIPLLLSA